MNNVIGARAPVWLRVVAALALIWNLMGVYAYLLSVGVLRGGDAAMSAASMPVWVTGAFAVGVFGGTLGSIGLLLLKRWAKPMLLASLLGVIVNDVWAFFLRVGPAESPIMPLAVNLIVLLLVALAYNADKKGWLS